jgi:hypothetical protein
VVSLETDGIAEAAVELQETHDRGEDMTPAMAESAEKILAFVSDRFSSRTAPDGSSWDPLKGKSESTGALEASVYARASETNVAYGASVDYAAAQHARRPFLPSDDDAGPTVALCDEIQEAIEEHVAPDATE